MQKTMGMWAMAMFVAAGSFTLTGCGDSSSETSAPTEAAKSDVESGIGAAAKAVDDTVTKVGDVAKIVEAAAKAYPLDTCIVSGKKIEAMDDALPHAPHATTGRTTEYSVRSVPRGCSWSHPFHFCEPSC